MINLQWLELPISRTTFHGLKAVPLKFSCIYNRNDLSQTSMHTRSVGSRHSLSAYTIRIIVSWNRPIHLLFASFILFADVSLLFTVDSWINFQGAEPCIIAFYLNKTVWNEKYGLLFFCNLMLLQCDQFLFTNVFQYNLSDPLLVPCELSLSCRTYAYSYSTNSILI